jgi:hypothetical protein
VERIAVNYPRELTRRHDGLGDQQTIDLFLDVADSAPLPRFAALDCFPSPGRTRRNIVEFAADAVDRVQQPADAFRH